MLTRLKQTIQRVVYSIVPIPSVPASYSQAGEDAVLRFLFADKNVRAILYLDVGTNLPDYGNNTYLFYRSGSRGVCVEADKTLIDRIKKVRPEDRIVNVGVSTTGRDEADFYILDGPGMNTFDKDEAERRVASGKYKLTDTVKVKLVDINSIIRVNCGRCPDLLSLDIEGLDLGVLESLDFESFPIPVVCVETCLYSESHVRPKNAAIVAFMCSIGYEVYADTYINTIFVRKTWFYGPAAS